MARLNTENCRSTGRAREITPIFEMISADISNFQGKIEKKEGRGCGLKGKMREEAQGLKQLGPPIFFDKIQYPPLKNYHHLHSGRYTS